MEKRNQGNSEKVVKIPFYLYFRLTNIVTIASLPIPFLSALVAFGLIIYHQAVWGFLLNMLGIGIFLVTNTAKGAYLARKNRFGFICYIFVSSISLLIAAVLPVIIWILK
jgi:hypothetical protein